MYYSRLDCILTFKGIKILSAYDNSKCLANMCIVNTFNEIGAELAQAFVCQSI